MATIALIDSGTSTSNGFTTASLTWGTNTFPFIIVGTANSSGNDTSHTVTGTETWVALGTGIQTHGDRRSSSLMSVSGGGTPTDEALTISGVGGNTYQETLWAAFEIAEYNSSFVPKSGIYQGNVTSGTTFDSGAIGTIAGSDLAIICGFFESAADSFAAASGTTELVKITGGAQYRSLLVGSSTTDSTPGLTWITSGNTAGMFALIAQDGATGSHGGGGAVTELLAQYGTHGMNTLTGGFRK